MLIEDRKPAHLDPRPRSFAGLMELYELNYIRLRCLCPDLLSIHGDWVSRVPGGMDLHLRVLEHTPYTTILTLTHLFHDDDAPSPDLRVRMYHDARQVEVLERPADGMDLAAHDPMARRRMLNHKWCLNRFLFKWLSYCLHQGHGPNASITAARTGDTSLPLID